MTKTDTTVEETPLTEAEELAMEEALVAAHEEEIGTEYYYAIRAQ
jgi:hypothetical protein